MDQHSFDQIISWFQKVHPNPSSKDLHNQASDYLVSMTSFLLACQEIGATSPAREELGFAVNVINFMQRRIQAGSLGIELNFDEADREMILRTLCAQIHACIGLAHMLQMDIGGALKERAESDDSRLGLDGQPIFNDKNKISVGAAFRQPDYIPFT